MKTFYMPDIKEQMKGEYDYGLKYARQVYYFDKNTTWYRPVGTTWRDSTGIHLGDAKQLIVKRRI